MAKLGPIERAAFRVMWKHLGFIGAVRVGLAVDRAEARGEPFADLPAAVGFHEVGSRAQAGPAVVLYRALCAYTQDRDRARRIVADVVEVGAIVFLGQNLGGLKREALARLDDTERRAFVEAQGAKFPNATLTWDDVSADRVQFTVSRCRLVELVHHAGHPELATLFCKGDATFFGTIEPDVVLERPHTLAGGDPHCTFVLSWRER